MAEGGCGEAVTWRRGFVRRSRRCYGREGAAARGEGGAAARHGCLGGLPLVGRKGACYGSQQALRAPSSMGLKGPWLEQCLRSATSTPRAPTAILIPPHTHTPKPDAGFWRFLESPTVVMPLACLTRGVFVRQWEA